jgi:SAM-dependent methyltransferase
MPETPPISRAEIAAWYNRRYAARQQKAYRQYAAYTHFLDSAGIDFRPNARFLDVGSGQGFLLLAAAERGLAPVGVDLSFEAVRVSRQTAPTAGGVTAVGEGLPFRAGTFEYLACMGTLEHHLDMAAALREFGRVTTPDARIILMVPNRDFLGYAPLKQKGTAQQEIKETLLSLAEWRRLFEDAGLRTTHIGIDDWFLRAPLDFSPGLGNLGRQILRKAALAVSPFHRTYAFVFVCGKK